MQTITGNTYPVRAQMRALGGTWNAGAQGWQMPDDKADEARAIVNAAGPAAPQYQKRRGGSSYTRFAGGGEVYTNRRGRCEDAPCCGCCS